VAKGKIIQLPQGQEKYIKTRARLLPIDKCYISKKWKELGECNIFITRKHSNGNFTAGFYLVDLFCLGVKDAFYYFNLPDYEIKNIIDNANDSGESIVECDYALAHNIIYGALDFAEEYGFNPHKDFAIAKYILAEDDDTTPFMDIEFGENGIPCLLVSKDRPLTREIAILKKNAAPGKYKIVDIDDILDEDMGYHGNNDSDGFIDKPFDEYNEQDIIDIVNGKKETSYENLRYISHIFYSNKFETKAQREESLIIEDRLCEVDTTDELPGLLNDKESSETQLFYKLYEEIEINPSHAIHEIKSAIEKYPHVGDYYNLLANAYKFCNQEDDSDITVQQFYEKFPENIIAKCNYSQLLIEENKHQQIPEVFENKFFIQDLYPERNEFNSSEYFSFCLVMANYYFLERQIHKARAYAEFLDELTFNENQEILKDQIQELIVQYEMNKLIENSKDD
jgi:hypothetical protein